MDTTGLPELPQDKATALASELVAAGEDARHVPVLADATGLGPVDRMVVTIEYSPFPLALVFQPATAAMEGGDLTLGRRVLTVMALSGHTRADLALIDQRTGTLIAGNLLFWTARPAFPMPLSRHGRRRLAPPGALTVVATISLPRRHQPGCRNLWRQGLFRRLGCQRLCPEQGHRQGRMAREIRRSQGRPYDDRRPTIIKDQESGKVLLIQGSSGDEFGVIGRLYARDPRCGRGIVDAPLCRRPQGHAAGRGKHAHRQPRALEHLGTVVGVYRHTLNDAWDFSGNNEIILFDCTDKNGNTHRAAERLPLVDQITWAKGIDLETVRPIEVEASTPLPE